MKVNNIVEIKLCCPTCGRILDTSETKLSCTNCSKSYPIIDGIPSFINTEDKFYEGRFINTQQYPADVHIHPLKKFLRDFEILFGMGNYRQRFLIKTLGNKQGSVLELGCGGGNQFFTAIGPVIGLDLSLTSLKNAKKVYSKVVQADLTTTLPFADETFDYVVSTDLMGHIPIKYKDRIISEIYRVLKEGGRTVNYIETDSNHPLFRFAKKYPKLFQRYFIEEIGGHYGLELPTNASERFRNAGFKPIYEKTAWDLFWPLEAYVNFLDNEYKEKSHYVKLIVVSSKLLRSKMITRTIANCTVGICSKLVSPFMRSDNKQGLLCCYEK